MVKTLGLIWALLFGVGVMQIGNGLQSTLLGVRAALEGFETGTTGIVMSAYFAGFLLGSFWTPRLVQEVGHIRVYAALAALASAAVLAYLLYIHPISWFLMRFVTGLCFSGLFIVAESWLNDKATTETRGRVFSAYLVISSIGVALGQFALNLDDIGGFRLFLISSILISIAVLPMLLREKRAPEIRFSAVGVMRVIDLYKSSPLAIAACFGIGLAMGCFHGLGPIYGVMMQLSTAEISLMMGVPILGGVLLQFFIGALSDRVDRRLVMIAVCMIGAVLAGLCLFQASLSLWLRLPLFLLFGGVIFSLYGLAVSHANDRIEPGQMVRAASVMMLVYGVGAVIGPVLIGQAMEIYGPAIFFPAIAGIVGSIGLFGLIRSLLADPTTDTDKIDYIPAVSRLSPLGQAVIRTVAREEIKAQAAEESPLPTPEKA